MQTSYYCIRLPMHHLNRLNMHVHTQSKATSTHTQLYKAARTQKLHNLFTMLSLIRSVTRLINGIFGVLTVHVHQPHEEDSIHWRSCSAPGAAHQPDLHHRHTWHLAWDAMSVNIYKYSDTIYINTSTCIVLVRHQPQLVQHTLPQLT